MHYHNEIIMPQVDNVEEAVATIMAPFSENNEDNFNAFWDWYVVGGRWAGIKEKAHLDNKKIQEFYSELEKRKVTVSSVTCGKQSLEPKSQIPMVDALWAEYFPSYRGKACPLFDHSNNQYENQCLYGDVMPLADVPLDLTASRVIIAGYNYRDALSAQCIFTDEVWNGCNHEKTQWDSTLKHALALHKENIADYKDEARERYTPMPDWLVVTVDTHS